MELPINDKELDTIISALRLGGDAVLYQKLNNVKATRQINSVKTEVDSEQFGFAL